MGLQLGGTQTDSAGNFTVQVPALKNIESYLDDDGQVALLFMSFDQNAQLMFRQYVKLPAGSMTAPAAQSINIGKECTRAFGTAPWSNYKWKREGSPIRTWLPVQRADTGSKTTMKYEWSNSKETFTQTSVEYGYKGVVSVGGSYSKSIKTGAGVNFIIGHDVVRDLEVEYDYYHYGLWRQLSGDATKWRNTSVREVRPYEFKGSTSRPPTPVTTGD